MIYVLTHEYFDRSAFTVCGVTEKHTFALAWSNANDENNVYAIEELDKTRNWMQGFDSWKQSNKSTGEK